MKRSANGSLAAAMALLIQNQAAYVADKREFEKEFASIRRRLDQIETILRHHDQVLTALTDAVAALPRKIGFKQSTD